MELLIYWVHLMFWMGLGLGFFGSQSQGVENLSQLAFPPEKNGVHVLPQRFEYDLFDRDHVEIGDILINANDLRVDLTPNPNSPEDLSLSIQWPDSFIGSGNLLLKDAVEKELWQTQIETEKVSKKMLKTPPKEGEESYTYPVRVYTFDKIEPDLVTKLLSQSFFRFCLRQDGALSRALLCSKSISLLQKGNKYETIFHDDNQEESFVELNGKMVPPQGIVSLGKNNNSIALRIFLQSGALIEISAENLSVAVEDFSLDREKQKYLVRLRDGEDRVSLLNLSMDRPYVYLQSQGVIPLRQEFKVRSPVRDSKAQIEIQNPPNNPVYERDYRLVLRAPRNMKIRTETAQDILVRRADGSYLWTLRDLPLSQKSNHNLILEGPGFIDLGRSNTNTEFKSRGQKASLTRSIASKSSSSYLATYGLLRIPNHEIQLGVGVPGKFFGLGKWWLNESLGAHLEAYPWGALGLSVRWRWTPGPYLYSFAQGPSLGVYSLSAEGSRSQSFALGYFWEVSSPQKIQKWFQWILAEILFSPLQVKLSGSDVTSNILANQGVLELRGLLRANQFYTARLGYLSASPMSSSYFFGGGIGWNF